MVNPVKGIHKWNIDAGLANKDYDRWLESYMLLEEIFEGMGIPEPKLEAKKFIKETQSRSDLFAVSEVDWLDHLCDVEFILHGSKCKMNLSPQQDTKSIMMVLEANNQKLKSGQDEHGKQKKPTDFIAPEPLLQKILDQRT